MCRFENIKIPFHTVGNKQVLYCYQLMEPAIKEFRELFDNCFEYEPMNQYHIFYPDGAPQKE